MSVRKNEILLMSIKSIGRGWIMMQRIAIILTTHAYKKPPSSLPGHSGCLKVRRMEIFFARAQRM
jgi:hypothetical protein